MATPDLTSFETPITAIIIGASGGIGSQFCETLAKHNHVERVFALSRNALDIRHDKITPHTIDVNDCESIKAAAEFVKSQDVTPNLIIVTNGILHDDGQGLQPEKSLKDIERDNFETIFGVNTITPALMMRYFLPLLPREGKSVFAALSARVGSISDNGKGGWYAYRASKAALNMLIKTASLEMARKYKENAVIGLHPGTVDTNLSKPFQGFVDPDHLFTRKQSIDYLLNVIDQRGAEDTGNIFDWNNKRIEP